MQKAQFQATFQSYKIETVYFQSVIEYIKYNPKNRRIKKNYLLLKEKCFAEYSQNYLKSKWRIREA